MTKEEIKEMIDATINENGQGNITGKALNLALNSIIDAMGEGGGVLDTVYLIPFNPTEVGMLEASEPTEMFWTLDDVMNMIEHNKTIYEKISNKFVNEKSIPQVSVDLSILAYLEYGQNAITNVGAGIMCFKIDESSSAPMSWNENNHYNPGDLAVLITPYYEAWMDLSTDYITFWLHSDGTCGLVNDGGNEE